MGFEIVKENHVNLAESLLVICTKLAENNNVFDWKITPPSTRNDQY